MCSFFFGSHEIETRVEFELDTFSKGERKHTPPLAVVERLLTTVQMSAAGQEQGQESGKARRASDHSAASTPIHKP